MIDGFDASVGLAGIGLVALAAAAVMLPPVGQKKTAKLIGGFGIFCIAPLFLRLLFAVVFN